MYTLLDIRVSACMRHKPLTEARELISALSRRVWLWSWVYSRTKRRVLTMISRIGDRRLEVVDRLDSNLGRDP